ncbi:hypothetical protein MSAN_00489700 [Mycena sanguinolenta]|uniref:Uncharacterized protein n=1 Tax=Mycena sanguinolenta TaxID=230812 RepID=A0A8H7DH08_9AGAR|nr:hypothetical protein MSAN_00489700 [Mycena sanguinolenta]
MSHAPRPTQSLHTRVLADVCGAESKSTTAAKIYEPPLRIKQSAPVLTLVSHHVTLEISSILGVLIHRLLRMNVLYLASSAFVLLNLCSIPLYRFASRLASSLLDFLAETLSRIHIRIVCSAQDPVQYQHPASPGSNSSSKFPPSSYLRPFLLCPLFLPPLSRSPSSAILAYRSTHPPSFACS